MPDLHTFTPFEGDTYYCQHQSPFGELLITGNQSAIRSITFPNKHWIIADQWQEEPAQFEAVRSQLDSYFAGTLEQFNLPLAPQGTDFQQSVWTQLMMIPYGATTTYGAIAHQLNNPKAMRAVGSANGRNPIPVIIPCHRVIGSNGSLTGFGGGLPTKSFLLDLENSEQLSLAL